MAFACTYLYIIHPNEFPLVLVCSVISVHLMSSKSSVGVASWSCIRDSKGKEGMHFLVMCVHVSSSLFKPLISVYVYSIIHSQAYFVLSVEWIGIWTSIIYVNSKLSSLAVFWCRGVTCMYGEFFVTNSGNHLFELNKRSGEKHEWTLWTQSLIYLCTLPLPLPGLPENEITIM